MVLKNFFSKNTLKYQFFSFFSTQQNMGHEWPPLKSLLLASIVSFGGSFNFGYQMGIINSLEHVLSEFTNETYQHHYSEPLPTGLFIILWPTMVCLLTLGAIFGALVTPQFTDKIGRKNTLYITSILLITASLPSALGECPNLNALRG